MLGFAHWLLLVHALVTWMMTGVIWLVQVVHYPLFAKVGEARFADYESEHMRRIGWLVAPLMLAEAAGAAALAWWRPAQVPGFLVWLGLALLAVIWLSTYFWQVPQHDRLQGGFDDEAHAALVRGNWLRTAAWTMRAGVVLAMLALSWRGPASTLPELPQQAVAPFPIGGR